MGELFDFYKTPVFIAIQTMLAYDAYLKIR